MPQRSNFCSETSFISNPSTLSLPSYGNLRSFLYFYEFRCLCFNFKLLFMDQPNISETFHESICRTCYLYYKNSKFLVLIVNGTKLPNLTIRHHWRTPADLVPDRKEFESYTQLENFVRDASPIVISNLTVYFYQLWSFNIAHPLFDGLYPAFVAFRLLTSLLGCETCRVMWVCGNFSGLALIDTNELSRRFSGSVSSLIFTHQTNRTYTCLNYRKVHLFSSTLKNTRSIPGTCFMSCRLIIHQCNA